MSEADPMEKPERPVVLITGGSGFIGSALVARLGKRYTVVTLDRGGGSPPRGAVARVDFDLSSDEKVQSALEEVRGRFGSRIASVVHLAAYYDVTGEPNPLYEKVTVQGTRRLMEGLQSFDVEQFIYASTMLVHQATDRPDETINENAPLQPSWAYPESKVRTEALLRKRHGRIPVVFLRIAGVYDDEGHQPFIAEQISRIYEHRLIGHLYPGMLCAGQSFIHLDDVGEAVEKLVERRCELPPELPLLVGEPEALGYGEVQDIIGHALHGEGWTTLRIPQPIAKVGAWAQSELLGEESSIKPWMVDASSDHYILDISRARRLLDWEPTHRLRDTLPKMVAALKRDPQGWYNANKLNPALVAWYGKRPEHQEAGHDVRSTGHADMDHSAMGHASPLPHTPVPLT